MGRRARESFPRRSREVETNEHSRRESRMEKRACGVWWTLWSNARFRTLNGWNYVFGLKGKAFDE